MVVTSFVLLLCVLGISKSVRAHTFEDYVCGFCSSRNGSNSLNMTENDISKFAQPCVTAPPQIVPLDFAIIANNPTFRQIIKSEVERILFNDTMLKNLAKTEVDLGESLVVLSSHPSVWPTQNLCLSPRLMSRSGQQIVGIYTLRSDFGYFSRFDLMLLLTFANQLNQLLLTTSW